MNNFGYYLVALAGMLAVVLSQGTSAQAQRYSEWFPPVNLGPVINTTSSDQGPAISKDRLSLYFTSDRTGGIGGFDMYVSHRESVDEPWGAPKNLGPIVNTTFDEGNPSFSRDGHLMFFQSKRSGGFGGIDIWVSRRNHTHDDFDWEPAVNLGSAVNTAADDNAPSYFENDETGVPQLYFASSRPGGLGGLDIYFSEEAADGSFGPATLLTELNSVGGDSRPSIRHDGLEIIFQSNRGGTTGGNDLWVATRESTHDAWSTPQNLGNSINTAFAEQNPYLSPDNLTLFFGSDRPGGSGGPDLYMSTRKQLRR